VAAAFAVSYYGLAGYFASDKGDVEIPEGLLLNGNGTFTKYSSLAAAGIKVKPDAEWQALAKALFGEKDQLVLKNLKTYTSRPVREAITSLMVATKINWFNTNHHVGQGGFTVFVAKAVKVPTRKNYSKPFIASGTG
jgi:hypothetical protein